MAKVDIGQKDGDSPAAKVDELVAGAGKKYPFQATFTNTQRKGLVVPSGKHEGVIPSNGSAVFTINTREQLWAIVMELAGAAETFKVDVIGTISVASAKSAAKEVQEPK